MAGPLSGIRIVELAGMGPGPFAGMMLADAGADILRIDRADAAPGPVRRNLLGRGRRSLAVDLATPQGRDLVLDLVEKADGLIEGYRPGVVERLGLGPEVCLERNPRLVYGRMTGWGQDGPMAARAGHDINYIALSGALEPIGRAGQPPSIPLNLVGDFGGGGMMLAFGMTAGLLHARTSGQGQVVDAAMIDGSALLTTSIHAMIEAGIWNGGRGGNILDSGAHFYQVYATADGRYVAVGALEPQFYAALLEGLGLQAEDLPGQQDRAAWPAMKARFQDIFASKTRDEWEAVFAGLDACFAPVLSPVEATRHPHNRQRATFEESGGVVQPAPAPRFSATPGAIPRPPPAPGEGGEQALADWGLDPARLSALADAGAAA